MQGEHYEYDGFVEKTVRDWFKRGNLSVDSKKKWDLETLEITKVPMVIPVDPVWMDLIPKRIEETYNMLTITCCVKQ